VAERLVPVRRTEARVDAGSCAAAFDGDAAGANGRSLLVRVPFAERRVLDPPAAGGTVPVAGSVGVDGAVCLAWAFLAWVVLTGVGAGEAFFAPPAVELPARDPPVGAPPVAEPDGVAAVPVDRADVDVRLRADDAGLGVGVSALMEQRYAVFSPRRESDLPAADSRRRPTSRPPRRSDSAAR
jgi:hypothetical protein